MVGNCDSGSSCAYTNTLSWKDPDTPYAGGSESALGIRAAVRHGGSESAGPDVRARRALYRNSILDEIAGRCADSWSRTWARPTGAKIDEYLTSIREVEKRITDDRERQAVPPIDKPSGIPFDYGEYVKLMFDLQVTAFQSDLTRVSTMMLGREGSVRTYPEIGVPDPHHPLTHHRGHPDFIEKVTKINCFHVELFAYFLDRLKRHAGRRRQPAGSLDDLVRRRAERRQRALERRSAAGARRRLGEMAGRAPRGRANPAGGQSVRRDDEQRWPGDSRRSPTARANWILTPR